MKLKNIVVFLKILTFFVLTRSYVKNDYITFCMINLFWKISNRH